MTTHSLFTNSAETSTKNLSMRRRFFVFCACLAVAYIALCSPFMKDAVPRVSAKAANSERHTTSALRQHLHRVAIRNTGNNSLWHTRGGSILDSANQPVRISGVNWSGFETTAAVPGGLKVQDYHNILRGISAAGYNTVRIPFSNQMIESSVVPSEIAFENATGPINKDLEGLNSLQILDRIISAAGEAGLKVILDNHRSEAGSSAEANGLWYTAEYPERAWIADWVSLADRYRGNATVIGFDLRNEPHNANNGGACWACGGANDWHLAAQRAGNAVLRTNANLLIFVEGTDSYNGETDFWGGDLAGARTAPVRLAVPGRLVYSAHVYGPTEYSQSWFNAHTSPASLAAFYSRHWGFLAESGVAPVWIGEFGTTNADADVASLEPGSEGQWFQALIGYLQEHPSIGWTYWGLNGEDRYGLFTADYNTSPANRMKSAALATVTAPTGSIYNAPAAVMAVAEASTYVPQRAAPAIIQSVVYAPARSVTARRTQFAVAYSRPAFMADATMVQHPRGAGHHVRPAEASAPEVELTEAEQVRRATAQALHGLSSQAE